MVKALLEVKNLRTEFHTEEGVFPALDDISFSLNAGETLGLVGESGCGKSVTALSIMRLLPYAGRITRGSIYFDGQNLLKKNEKEMRKIRGRRLSMIFQEPMTSLNPVYTIGDQVAEVIMIHRNTSKKEALAQAVKALEMVMIPMPESKIKEYPHQLSGGMRQRVMIAMALACNPEILIADEPTTALDVTIQAQIINLMLKLKEELGTAIILITHDLGVVAEMAQRVAVMYAGKIVEMADVQTIFEGALNPYTEGLLKSIPSIEQEGKKLHVIKGSVPHPLHMPQGCSFHPRCPYVIDKCREVPPGLINVSATHYVCCWNINREVKQ
ncbi:MAG: ABC transporter ATP-binding protein [Bacillota bacterium]